MDVALSILSEQKTHANFFLQKGGVEKEAFAEYVSGESADIEDGQLTGEAAKALKAFTTNLNDQVQKEKVDPVIGRAEELESIALALGRRSKNNVLMVGDPGVGKTAIAEGLAWNIVNDQVPAFLKEYEVYNLDIGSMLAGSQISG